MTVALDTNVASFIFKRDSRAALYANAIAGHPIVLPFQVVAEMLDGAEAHGYGVRRRAELRDFLQPLPFVTCDRHVIDAWVVAMRRSASIGRRLEAADAWVAACAMAAGARLLTHDTNFEGLGISGLSVVCHAA